MKKCIKIAILLVFAVIFGSFCPIVTQEVSAASVETISVESKSAYLIDANTQTVVFAKNENEKLPIASMTKLATLAIIFDEIDSGRLNLKDKISVSQNAADTEGSSAFLDAGSKYSIEDLIKTIIVVSANDSCVALAEHICGTEALFASKMNEFAKTLNLKNTHFENSTGLPSAEHYSSAKDMAIIYQKICNHEIYKKFSKIWMEDFIHPSGRKTGLVNTNRLIKTYDGCTGGKTGHTNEAKYCLTSSATRNGTTLISVIIGAQTSALRFDESKKLFDFGFANYYTKQIVDTHTPLLEVDVLGAKDKTVYAYADRDYFVFQKKDQQTTYSTHVLQDEKIVAPLSSGQSVGKVLILDQNNIIQCELNLIVCQDVPQIEYKEILKNIFINW